MAEQYLFYAGVACALGGLAVLRFSWSRARRSVPLNVAGWLLFTVSLAIGWGLAGAWGATIMSLWAMGAAFVALGIAALSSPAGKRKVPSRRANLLPETGEPLHLGRRCATFFLIVLVGMLSAIALAITTRWLALLIGASEANANVLALFVAPLGWTILSFLMLITDSRRRQLAYLAVPVATALPAIVTGSLL